MSYPDHPFFAHPVEPQRAIWHYIDLGKFVDMLDRSALYFTRADAFHDPVETQSSKLSETLLRASAGLRSEEALRDFIAAADRFRKQVYLNCWHLSEQDSPALWVRYFKDVREGLAIQSTFGDLRSALDESPYSIGLGCVRYVDFENVPIPLGNPFFPYVHKRLDCAHEQEVRALLWSEHEINRQHVRGQPIGLHVPVDLQRVLKSVHVGPAAPDWFRHSVASVCKKYGLTASVEQGAPRKGSPHALPAAVNE